MSKISEYGNYEVKDLEKVDYVKKSGTSINTIRIYKSNEDTESEIL